MKKQKNKLQTKKQKTRERRNKKTVIKKREFKRREDKIKKTEQLVLDAEAAEFEKTEPFRNLGTIERQEKERSASVLSQLEHNLEILQALEEQHLKEEMQREEVNEELDTAGCSTMAEKIQYLKDKAEKEGEKYHMDDDFDMSDI